MNTLAWNNGIGLRLMSLAREGLPGVSSFAFIVLFCWFSGPQSWSRGTVGASYSVVRGEILGFMEDERVRKHLPRMFSLIKNESWGFEDDQIPS